MKLKLYLATLDPENGVPYTLYSLRSIKRDEIVVNWFEIWTPFIRRGSPSSDLLYLLTDEAYDKYGVKILLTEIELQII